MRLSPARAVELVVAKGDAGDAPAAEIRPHDGRRAVVAAAAIAGCAAYFVALHALIVAHAMPALTLALVLAPWFVALAPLAIAKLRDASPTGRVATAGAAIAVVVAGAWTLRHVDVGAPLRADLVLYLENAAFFAWLSSLFASSLMRPGDALVTRMARRVRGGDMPPVVVRYTRRLTAAWALFFVAVVALSTVLFFDASRDAWSLFVNLLIWPLIGAAFVAEYAIRSLVLRDVDHAPFSAAFRAFRDVAHEADAADRR